MIELLDPKTLKGQVEICLRLHSELTRIGDLDDVHIAILFIVHDHDTINISTVWKTLGEDFSLKVPYPKVWNVVRQLQKKELITLKKDAHKRGRPAFISIEPQGSWVVQKVLARARTMLRLIPDEARATILQALQHALKILESSEQPQREGDSLAELSILIQTQKIKLNEPFN